MGSTPSSPLRVGVVFGDKADRYILSVPVTKFPNFRKNNIASILTPHIKKVGDEPVEAWGTACASDFNGYMLYTAPYAHIGETQKDVTDVPADPRTALQPLLGEELPGCRRVRQPADRRRRAEEAARTLPDDAEAVARSPEEAEGRNAGRFRSAQEALEIELDEAEWFFSESQHTHLGLTLDEKQGTGRLDIEMTPIAGTPLAQSVDQLQTKASHFANIEKSADPILSARFNHPLSEIRKKTASAMAALAKARAASRIESDDKLSADQKQASKQILDQSFALLEAGFKAGLADGFLDVHKGASGKNVLLGAVWTPDGSKVPEILALLPKARAGENVKLKVAEESGVTIHSVDLAKDHVYWNDFHRSDDALRRCRERGGLGGGR